MENIGLINSLKRIAKEVTGLKSSCLSHSYNLATFVIVFNLVAIYVLIILAGIISGFNLYVDTLKDFIITIFTGTMAFCSIAITTCLGATAIDNKKAEENKNEVAG